MKHANPHLILHEGMKKFLIVTALFGSCNLFAGIPSPLDTNIVAAYPFGSRSNFQGKLPYSSPVDGKIHWTNDFSGIGGISVNASNTTLNYITNFVDKSFNIVSAFGAKGDGKVLFGAASTLGSRTVTVTNGNFTTNDVGKVAMIYGAGPSNYIDFAYVYQTNNVPYITNHLIWTNRECFTSIITNVANNNTITLSNAATGTITDSTIVYGHDDTAAIQFALDYSGTNGGGTIRFLEGIYILNGALRNEGPPTNSHNAQLYLPNMLDVPGQVAPSIRLIGPYTPSALEPHEQIKRRFNAVGATIWSTLTADQIGTNNYGKLLDCQNFSSPTFQGGCPTALSFFADSSVHFNATRIEINNLTFRTPSNPKISCLDLAGAVTASVKDIYVDTGYNIGAAEFPQYTNSYGIKLPPSLCAGNVSADNLVVYGFHNGVGVGEHGFYPYIIIGDCWNGLLCYSGGHWSSFGNLDIEVCKNQITSRFGDCPYGINANVTGENFDATHWTYPPVFINDPANNLYGTINYEHTSSESFTNVGPFNPSLYIARYGPAQLQATIQTPIVSNRRFSVGSLEATNQDGLGFNIVARQMDNSNPSMVLQLSGAGGPFWKIWQTTDFTYPVGDHFILQGLGTNWNFNALDISPNGLFTFTATNKITGLAGTGTRSVNTLSDGTLVEGNAGATTNYWTIDPTVGIINTFGQVKVVNNGGYGLVVQTTDNSESKQYFRTTTGGPLTVFRQFGELGGGNLDSSTFKIQKFGGGGYDFLPFEIRTNADLVLRTNVQVEGQLGITGIGVPQGTPTLVVKVSTSTSTNIADFYGFNATKPAVWVSGDGSLGTTNYFSAGLTANNGSFPFGISITTGDILGTNRIIGNAFLSNTNNKQDTVAISVTASVFHWTNNTAGNVFAFIDAHLATTMSVSLNSGTAVFAGVQDVTLPLQKGESFDLTYTGTAPTARWKSW